MLLYIGTLTRCIDSLEQQERDSTYSNSSPKENRAATSALRQLLNAAYQVNVQINPDNAFMNLVDKMKRVGAECV